MLDRLDDKYLEARCDRCLAPSPTLPGARELAETKLRELGWTPYRHEQWYCVECSAKPPATGPATRTRRRQR